MKIHFWGATQDVTGSMTFVDMPEGRLLIDCGLTQGNEEKEKLNLDPLPYKAKDISSVIITHAHLDHSGYLPRLVKNGYRGPVYCTPATAKLMRIILMDSAGLSKEGFYEEADVIQTLTQVKTKEWHDHFSVNGGDVQMIPAGHILGASSVVINAEGKKILFSGDLGRFDDPILLPHDNAPAADIVVMESTYGNKNRKGNMVKELHSFLMTISRESRVGIIASFAVARAQTLLTLIHEFYESHPEYKARLAFDSPMMKEANRVYQQYAHMTSHKDSVFTALDEADAIEYHREWNSLKKKNGPLVIISSSGMLTGGRINRHLFNWKDDEKAILFLPGYQAEGTPGRSMVEGDRTLKTQDGSPFTWMGEVLTSEAFSSHADQSELLKWIGVENKSTRVFLLHGEAESKKALYEKLNDQGFPSVFIPARGESFEI